MSNPTVTIEGETWYARLTPEEYDQWCIYADHHGWLLSACYDRTLSMFLAHLRRGINLNDPLKP